MPVAISATYRNTGMRIIYHCKQKLTSLAGLDNIDSIKNGVLIQNNSIKDINALTKLKYCKWGLTIEEDSLVNLSGLENLNYAFQFHFKVKILVKFP